MTYRFGTFSADRTTYRVVEDAGPVELTPKLLDLLFYFLERPATLVTKEELLDAVWPGANVTDNALAQAISELREVLGDRASAPTFIKTVARRGYRFVAPVEEVGPRPAARPGAAALSAAAASAEARSGPVPGAVGLSGADAAPDALRTVLVMDFDNVTGDADIAWLSAGIAETVTSDLATLGAFVVIDRWRVLQVGRQTGGSMDQIGAALGADLAVTGGFQRLGSSLRITARVINLFTGESVADAKVDGPLDSVFALQDAVAATFARELGVSGTTRRGRRAGRDTSSLEAYRAYTEGWLKIESLDTDQVAASILDFERAIAFDRSYALAHTGLANAAFVAYEMTRARRDPDHQALEAGIEHARHAIELDHDLAEAHATLSFLLVAAGAFGDARTAAERAVALEPDSWRHQYRLGHASWGSARLRAFDRAVAIYPRFPYAHFEASMVHVARGHLEAAADIARQQVAWQDREAKSGHRFPAVGFHWMSGAIAAAGGRHDEALAHFDRELAQVDPRRLYGPEYGALALVGRGQIELAMDGAAAALASFRDARVHVPGHGRAYLGEAVALSRLGEARAAEAAWQEVAAAERDETRGGPRPDAHYLAACADAMRGDAHRAVGHLDRLLDSSAPGFSGWTIPLEPFLRPLGGDAGFQHILDELAARAL